MSEKSIGFIGGGRVAKILLGGFKKAGTTPGRLVVSDKDERVLIDFKKAFKGIEIALGDNKKAASQDLVFLAVHPPVVKEVLNEIGSSLKSEAVLVSLAPKLTVSRLTALLDGFGRIVRMIPNAPSIVGSGYNPVYFSPAIPSQDKPELLELFRSLGDCPEMKESKLEAYAILSAMGPTYFWFQFYELLSIVESFGLTPEEAWEGMEKMLTGSLKTMSDSGLSADEVVDLIPVKPLADKEQEIKKSFQAKLEGLYAKLKVS